MPYLMGDFQINERLMRYSTFIPRFYNLCRSYGFEEGKIMPSRAFCSDENQGFPIILITKHFGTFPFNHGRIGGIVATGRHSAHAHHGKDLVIIQASHVGYDPETARFGTYRRLQTDPQHRTTACGKISGILDWYRREYNFARENIAFSRLDEEDVVIIDNRLLDLDRHAGLFLSMESLIDLEAGSKPKPFHVFNTSKAFRVHTDFKTRLPASVWQQNRRKIIGKWLSADLFQFRRDIPKNPEGQDRLALNLSYNMPQIITAAFPHLVAAQTSTQIEFEHVYRTIINEHEYQGKNLAFVSGVNIDISPGKGQVFPQTKFVPWAAFIQTRQGRQFFLEQDELFEVLHSQSTKNRAQIDLENAIRVTSKAPVLKIKPDTGSFR